MITNADPTEALTREDLKMLYLAISNLKCGDHESGCPVLGNKYGGCTKCAILTSKLTDMMYKFMKNED